MGYLVAALMVLFVVGFYAISPGVTCTGAAAGPKIASTITIAGCP